jgi:hypothetical protein
MNEFALRELLEHVTDEEPPVGPLAQNSLLLGARLRRRRRARFAAAVPLLAAATVLAVALSGTLMGPAPAYVPPAQRPSQEVPSLYLLPRWLPPGMSAASGAVFPRHQETLYLTEGNSEVGKIISWSGPCTVSRPKLACGQNSWSPLGPRTGTINGFPAYWSRYGLFSEWARDQWVLIQLSDRADALQVARHLTAHVPAIRYPLQLTGSWPGAGLQNVGFSLTRGHAIADGMALTRDANLNAPVLAFPQNAVQISVALAGSPLGCPSSGTHAVINSYQVIIAWIDRHGADPIEDVCASNADGHLVRAHSEGKHLVAPATVVFAHLRLLGPDPAKWPTTPFG